MVLPSFVQHVETIKVARERAGEKLAIDGFGSIVIFIFIIIIIPRGSVVY